MAISIINPKFSFLQFVQSGVGTPVCDTPLPVATDYDVKFQLVVKYTGDIYNVFDFANIYAVEPDAVITNNTELVAATLVNLGGMPPDILQIASDKLLLTWASGLPSLAYFLLPDQCFRFCISLQEDCDSPLTYWVSNCFKKTSDLKYTSTIEYSCDENAYAFEYCDSGVVNKIRIPMYLTKPQYKDDVSVYIKSDGSRKIHKAVISKQYECLTAELSDATHEKINVALNHDNVIVESNNYTGGLRKDGEYAIDWIDYLDEQLAQASFKAYTTPYNARNNNCEVCETLPLFPPWEDCPPPEIECAQINSLFGDNGGNDALWETYISACTYSINPIPGNNQIVDIYYREGGTSGAFTFVGTITFSSSGAVLSTPNPFVISSLPGTWLSVQIKAVNQCGGDDYLVTRNNPFIFQPCGLPSNLTIISINPSIVTPGYFDVSASWNRVLPTPAAGYDWELQTNPASPSPIDSGNTTNPGGTIFLTIESVPDGGSWALKVRSNCGDGNSSLWISTNFTTP